MAGPLPPPPPHAAAEDTEESSSPPEQDPWVSTLYLENLPPQNLEEADEETEEETAPGHNEKEEERPCEEEEERPHETSQDGGEKHPSASGSMNITSFMRNKRRQNSATKQERQDSPNEEEGEEENKEAYGMTAAEYKIICNLPAASNEKDLNIFLRLCKYFHGDIPLEEMMYQQDVSRQSILRVLQAFSEVLLVVMY